MGPNNFSTQLQTKLQQMTAAPVAIANHLNSSALVQALQQVSRALDKKSPVADPRAAKGAYPIASMSNGNVLMSDGTINGPVNNQARALIQNTLDQTSYTPAAQEQIKRMPVTVQNLKGGTLGMYGFDGSPTNAGITLSYNLFNRSKPNVSISPEQQTSINNYANARAVEVLRHEFNHSFDSNITQTSTPASGNSNGFYSEMTRPENLTPMARNTANFVNNYHGTPTVNDRESFAQYGSGGQNVYLDKTTLSQRYNNIFSPMNKKMNYSPIFMADWNDNGK